ncbi:MAG: hypothetical protein HYZ38_26575 [Mycobacterium sp.]|nr:hypothetical protein [Mycobacterium sp.]
MHVDPATAAAEPALPQDDLRPAGEAADAEVAAPPDTGPVGVSESSTESQLFAEHELVELRARWDAVQAAFVDDPRECVHKADGLVSDLVEQLTAGFANARSRLEEQWARGEQASTEDLRIALQHYRDFFQRLLAV